MTKWSLLAFVLLPLTAQATVLADWDLAELVRRSDAIVIGTITEQHTVATERGLMTESTVAVEETLRGAKQKTLTVSQLGGTQNGRTTWIEGDARLRKEHRMLLFTYAHEDGRRYLVGMALGAFLVNGDQLTQTLIDTARTRSLRALRTILDGATR